MIEQAALAILSLTATYLSLHTQESRRRFACFAGLAVQPLWLHSTAHAHQWGMFALCWVYLAIYVKSLWHFWISPRL